MWEVPGGRKSIGPTFRKWARGETDVFTDSRESARDSFNGQIIPSPGNALERQALREDLMRSIHDLQVRIKLLEARENDRRK